MMPHGIQLSAQQLPFNAFKSPQSTAPGVPRGTQGCSHAAQRTPKA